MAFCTRVSSRARPRRPRSGHRGLPVQCRRQPRRYRICDSGRGRRFPGGLRATGNGHDRQHRDRAQATAGARGRTGTGRPLRLDPHPSEVARVSHRIAISGGDQLGLVARLAEVFRQYGANIVRLEARKLPAAEGGLYVTRFAVWIPPERANLSRHGRQHGRDPRPVVRDGGERRARRQVQGDAAERSTGGRALVPYGEGAIAGFSNHRQTSSKSANSCSRSTNGAGRSSGGRSLRSSTDQPLLVSTLERGPRDDHPIEHDVIAPGREHDGVYAMRDGPGSRFKSSSGRAVTAQMLRLIVKFSRFL